MYFLFGPAVSRGTIPAHHPREKRLAPSPADFSPGYKRMGAEVAA
jgi:hypothetical protein